MPLVINPHIEIKDSPIQCKGLFTKVPIRKGEAIWISKGAEPVEEKIYDEKEFEAFQKWCIEHDKEWDAVALSNGLHRAAVAG